MHFDRRDELGKAALLVEARPLHAEIGRIDLQNETVLDDAFVFVFQRTGQRENVVLEAVVVEVDHRRRGEARRYRSHEDVGEPVLRIREGILEPPAFRDDTAKIVVDQRTCRLGQPVGAYSPPTALPELREPDGERLRVHGQLASRPVAPSETGDPVRDVGNEVRARNLSVVADVYADFGLPDDREGQRLRDRVVEGIGIDRFAVRLRDEEVRKPFPARKTAHMRGQDPVVTGFHVPRFVPRRRGRHPSPSDLPRDPSPWRRNPPIRGSSRAWRPCPRPRIRAAVPAGAATG